MIIKLKILWIILTYYTLLILCDEEIDSHTFFPFYEIATYFSSYSYVYLCAELISTIINHEIRFALRNRLLHSYHATLTIKYQTQ